VRPPGFWVLPCGSCKENWLRRKANPGKSGSGFPHGTFLYHRTGHSCDQRKKLTYRNNLPTILSLWKNLRGMPRRSWPPHATAWACPTRTANKVNTESNNGLCILEPLLGCLASFTIGLRHRDSRHKDRRYRASGSVVFLPASLVRQLQGAM
jgi:hypothetical protein